MNYIISIFSDLQEINSPTMLAIGLLIGLFVGIVIGLSAARQRIKWDARILSHGSLLIALSFLLSYVKFYSWPQGGSVTAASMLPLMAFAYMYGTPYGLVAGFAYSLLQIIQGAYVVHPVQLILDYPAAFTALGLAGLARNIKLPEKSAFLKLAVGVLIGGLARTIMHTISGVLFFWEYAPEGQSYLWYSISVNFTVTGTDALICAVIAAIPTVAKLFPQNVTASRT